MSTPRNAHDAQRQLVASSLLLADSRADRRDGPKRKPTVVVTAPVPPGLLEDVDFPGCYTTAPAPSYADSIWNEAA